MKIKICVLLVMYSFSISACYNNQENKKREAKAIVALKKQAEKLVAVPGNLADYQWNDQESPLLNGDIYRFPDLVKKLIDKKANLEVQDNHGLTPLHVAVLYRSREGALLLLNAGANPHHVSEWALHKDTVLTQAISDGNQIDLVDTLLSHNLKMNESNQEINPLHVAIRYGTNPLTLNKNRQTIVRSLLAHGSNPLFICDDKSNVMQMLKKYYESDAKSFLDHENTWRHKAIGQMFIYYAEAKRALKRVRSINGSYLPEEIAQHIVQYTFSAPPKQTCPICLEKATEISTGCKHDFCNTCITSWLEKNKNCPLCRRILIKDYKR